MKWQAILRESKDWIISIGIAVAAVLIIRAYIAEIYAVDGNSMEPVLQNNERIIVNKFVYHFKPLQRGDIVVFKYPSNPNHEFIKRVVAKAGDTLQIADGNVYINGQRINEPYVLEEMKTNNDYPRTIIPANSIFVMSDHRNNSEDSRFANLDMISCDSIKGKVAFLAWPLTKMRSLP